MTDEYFETSSKKGRGLARRSLELIEAMCTLIKTAQPITGRGAGYKLFVAGLISSMAPTEMQKVYRLLKLARERGDIPWKWIVDETRAIERVSTWSNPAEYAECAARSYRRDFWDQQPHRVQVWSEKGTVRGVLAPVLNAYAAGFLPVHGFSSATAAHDIAEDDDGRPLHVLYAGGFLPVHGFSSATAAHDIAEDDDGRPLHVLYAGGYDPSGMFMSEEDLPARFAKYDGDHIKLRRIALTHEQVRGLPPFPASDKRKDPRYRWFAANHGEQCWEIDAMDPNDLRNCVEREIERLIEPLAWERCEIVNAAEQNSLKSILEKWSV
jgi:hypothetical protein